MMKKRITPTMPIVVYCRFRYACAPAWMAAAISCMRGLPAGLARTQRMETAPYTIAATAQTSAKISALDMELSLKETLDRETAPASVILRKLAGGAFAWLQAPAVPVR